MNDTMDHLSIYVDKATESILYKQIDANISSVEDLIENFPCAQIISVEESFGDENAPGLLKNPSICFSIYYIDCLLPSIQIIYYCPIFSYALKANF